MSLAVLLCAAFAWAVVALPGTHGPGWHGALERPGPLVAGEVLAGWVLMTAAMMLPAALPLFSLLDRLAAGAEHRRKAAVATASMGGFLVPWAVVGSGAVVADAAVHGLAHRLGVNTHTTGIPLGLTLLLAGAVQFSPLTRRCLDACRSPEGFLVRMWRGGRPVGDAARLGWAYGVSCVGCCWALMLVCFALGGTSLMVMVGAAVLMATERLVRHGRRVANVTGAASLLAGAVVLLP